MILVYLLCVISLSSARQLFTNKMAQLTFFAVVMLAGVAFANIIKVNEQTLKKEVVTTVKGVITDFVVDSKTGNLFFNEIQETNTLNLYKPGQDGYKQIEGFKGYPQGLAINEDNGNVFIGTTQGLYKLTKEKRTPELIGEEGKNIIIVQYRNNVLYFVTYPGFIPYKSSKVNGEYKVEEIFIDYADGFIVDSENNIYYVNETGHLRKRPHGQTVSIPIKGLEGKHITATTVGPDDRILIAAGKETWVLRKGETEVKTPLISGKDTITAAFSDKNKVTYVVEGHTINKYTRQYDGASTRLL